MLRERNTLNYFRSLPPRESHRRLEKVRMCGLLNNNINGQSTAAAMDKIYSKLRKTAKLH